MTRRHSCFEKDDGALDWFDRQTCHLRSNLRGPTPSSVDHHRRGQMFSVSQRDPCDLISGPCDPDDWRILTYLHAEVYNRPGERLEQAWGTHLSHVRQPHPTVQRQIRCEIRLALAYGCRVEPLDAIAGRLLPGHTLLIGMGF